MLRHDMVESRMDWFFQEVIASFWKYFPDIEKDWWWTCRLYDRTCHVTKRLNVYCIDLKTQTSSFPLIRDSHVRHSEESSDIT